MMPRNELMRCCCCLTQRLFGASLIQPVQDFHYTLQINNTLLLLLQ
jgi:hypothetical protein